MHLYEYMLSMQNKEFQHSEGHFPLSMIWLANQLVCVFEWLSNFQPTLVPAPTECSETEVDDYFQAFEDSDFSSDIDSDSEMC